MLLLMLLRILLDYFDCLETFKFTLYKSLSALLTRRAMTLRDNSGGENGTLRPCSRMVQ